MNSTKEFIGYIKYFGPLVDDGSVDISKAGRSLVALDKFFKKYQKEFLKIEKDNQYILKIASVNKNCSEIIFGLVELAKSTPANFALVAFGLENLGVGEFGKKFFGVLGEQLALKILSKGKRMKNVKEFAEGNNHFVILENANGDSKKVSMEQWEIYKKLNPYLSGLIQLEKGKEEKMKIGYKQKEKDIEVANVQYKEKEYFDSYENFSTDERLKEPFDAENAKDEKLVGKFVDFYGLAHKYHFAFQARKKQDDVGKQKILCIVDKEKISKILDYLKPENSKNVCIFGKATRDWEGKVDKIKIEWISEKEDYDPNQTKMN